MRFSTTSVALVAWSLIGNPVSLGAEDLSPRPNIVLILADDMGWSDIGCYGSEIPTPNLDRLAADGMRFTQIHNTAKCFPSRACLLTGLYAQQSGMDLTPLSRQENAVTFGRVLRDAGYRTLMVGKHHGLDNPYEMGFDHYFGMRDGAGNYFNPGLQREGEALPAQKRPGKRFWCFDDLVLQPYTPANQDFYSTDAFTDWAMTFLDEYEDDDRPFLLYLAYQAPHDPLQAWPEDIARHKGVYDVGYEPIASARYQRQLEMGLIDEAFPRSTPTHRDWDAMTAEEHENQARRMTVYAAMIDRLDQNIGRLLTKLEELGKMDNTLILFASDNGASAEIVEVGDGEIGAIDRWSSLGGDWANVSNTPFRKFKNYSHEGGICTPLIAHWPGRIAQGAISHEAGHFVDIMPTLVELAGATYPSEVNGAGIPPMQGISLMPAFEGGELDRADPLYFRWKKGRAIIDGDWKAVRSEPEEWELYRIREDRTETKDLAENEPDVLERMIDRYEAWVAEVGAE